MTATLPEPAAAEAPRFEWFAEALVATSLRLDDGVLGIEWHDEAHEPVVDFLDRLIFANPAADVRARELLAGRTPDPDGARRIAPAEIIGLLDAEPGASHLEAAHDGEAVELLAQVTASLVAAEQAATRALSAEFRAASWSAVVGMVERVLAAGTDRPTLLAWLEERLALHVLANRLAEQAATSVLDRTLAALPGDDFDRRDGATRLRHAAGRAYRRILGRAAPDVRTHLTREWAQAVDALAAEGWPIDGVEWLATARAWLSEVETAEQDA